MGWLARLFDARDTFLRWVLLDISGISYLVVNAHHPIGIKQLVLAVVAYTAALLCHRRPVVNLAIQITLLLVAVIVIDDVMINQVGACWALLELTLWAPRLPIVWWGAAALFTVRLVDSIGDPWHAWIKNAWGAGIIVGLPLLGGLVVRTSRELTRQGEQRALEQQRRLESETREARAAERAAIARELHDVVAHHVASMVLRVGVARDVLPGLDPRVAEVFDDVRGTGSAALADLRRLVAVLRTPEGVTGDAALTAIEASALPAALDAAVDRARQAGVRVEAEVDPAVGTLDGLRGLAVLRLTQEALTNVAKHAGAAARARLTVSVDAGTVHWAVADDGHGTVADPVPAGGGNGLTGMRERVAVLGGELSAGPTGSGWRVAATLPVPQVAA
jgi:signal transduction histidine kinase